MNKLVILLLPFLAFGSACSVPEREASSQGFDDLVAAYYGSMLWDEGSSPVRFIMLCNAKFRANPHLSECPGVSSEPAWLDAVSQSLINLWKGNPEPTQNLVVELKEHGHPAWSTALELELNSILWDQQALGKQLNSITEIAPLLVYKQSHLSANCQWDSLNVFLGGLRPVDSVEEFIVLLGQAGVSYRMGDADRLSATLEKMRSDYGHLLEFRLAEQQLAFLTDGELRMNEIRRQVFRDFRGHHTMRYSLLLEQVFSAEEEGFSSEAQGKAISRYLKHYGKDVLSVLRVGLEFAHYGFWDQFDLVAEHLRDQPSGLEDFLMMKVLRAYQAFHAGETDTALQWLSAALEMAPMSRDVNLATIRISERSNKAGPWERAVLSLMECEPFEVESLVFLRIFLNHHESRDAYEWLNHARQYRHLYSPLVQQLLQ